MRRPNKRQRKKNMLQRNWKRKWNRILDKRDPWGAAPTIIINSVPSDTAGWQV